LDGAGGLSPDDKRLIAGGADVGVAIGANGQMALRRIAPGMMQDYLGVHVEAVRAGSGIAFWFSAVGSWSTVNRMATLNLLAAGQYPPSAVPLLWGPVLITGTAADGQPAGLTNAQVDALADGAAPNWFGLLVLTARENQAQRRRAKAHRS
jgi:hypothetical protein